MPSPIKREAEQNGMKRCLSAKRSSCAIMVSRDRFSRPFSSITPSVTTRCPGSRPLTIPIMSPTRLPSGDGSLLEYAGRDLPVDEILAVRLERRRHAGTTGIGLHGIDVADPAEHFGPQPPAGLSISARTFTVRVCGSTVSAMRVTRARNFSPG